MVFTCIICFILKHSKPFGNGIDNVKKVCYNHFMNSNAAAVKTLKQSFLPSHYQQAVFDWAKNGGNAAVVNAVAGGGKTSTLIELSKLINTKDALFVAFNVNIVKELQSRLGTGFTATTINSLGNRALMNSIKGYKGMATARKYNSILFPLVTESGRIEKKDIYVTISRIEDFIKKGMADLSDWSDESLTTVSDHYGLEFPKKFSTAETFDMVRQAVKIGERQVEAGIINFDEQIYCPVKLQIRPVQASFLMVDEGQDLSKSKLELVLSAIKPGGRFLAVADKFQSIYGFCGADAGAVDNIIARTNAIQLPLSVSYRCSKAVVNHAQELVPHIEAAPNAPEGTVGWVSESELLKNVKAGDFVLCRKTAPLVGMCIKFLKNRIPAKVKGKDIGKQLVDVAKDALNGRYNWNQLDMALDAYLSAQVTRLMERPNSEKAIIALQDKVEGVRVIASGFRSVSLEAFEQEINKLFKGDDENTPGVVEMSTVHKAKGLEADTVYIIEPSCLPLYWKGQQDWEKIQENNIDYVARTRARLNLFYVESDPKVDSE